MAQLFPNAPCPCGSAAKYKRCCGLFHRGVPAPDALTLMKSRYVAYAVGDAHYIVTTTHPESGEFDADTSAWLARIGQYSRATEFQGLIIQSFEDGPARAHVTFYAQLRQHGADASFTEKSEFVRVNDRWLYRAGARL
ncbi:MAG TPA: YchJ family metal-binding protein [Myxococcota bacterium]|nr:YchJ family metal-binding protein [Myxococcota bacterium]